MTAMGVERFVVTLRHAVEDKAEERHWSKGDVMHSMAWLKRMNARGYDVLIRPDGEHGLVLLVGLNKEDLDTLHQRGFGPAVALDIDRKSYQAWIKLSVGPISEDTSERAVRGLKKGLRLPESIETKEKDSRLAGLTNRSADSKNERAPYTLVTEATGKVALAAQDYLQWTQLETAQEMTERQKQRNRSQGRSR